MISNSALWPLGHEYHRVAGVFTYLIRHGTAQHDAFASGIIPPRGTCLDIKVQRVGRGVKTDKRQLARFKVRRDIAFELHSHADSGVYRFNPVHSFRNQSAHLIEVLPFIGGDSYFIAKRIKHSVDLFVDRSKHCEDAHKCRDRERQRQPGQHQTALLARHVTGGLFGNRRQRHDIDCPSPEALAVVARDAHVGHGLQYGDARTEEDRDDPDRFIAAFTGSNRYVGDYLTDEVLASQSAETIEFLERTSIVDRLTGPLCDAVTGRSDSEIVLRGLERANLFVVALDDQRQWYRYHQLFRDALLERLRQSKVNVQELHRLAGRWFGEKRLLP